jgi:4-amino-4-deoxy-L-arabinose transferase-like glycosyltransferase
MEPGDYDQAYQNEVVGSRFDPTYSVESFEYEDYQPPLYYLLATPAYVVSAGALEAVRLVSVLLGAVVVSCAYVIGIQLYPTRRWFALTVATFVAFLPQHMAMLAAANNDSLSEALIALMLVVLVTSFAGAASALSRRKLLLLGLLLGLGFLTKVTVYLMAPVIGVALLLHYWRRWPELVRAGLTAFVPAFLIGLLWWGRNVVVYPGLDFLGKQAHDSIVIGQPKTAQWIAEFGLGFTGELFVRTSFQSFWGQFGWMGVPMPTWVYRALLLFTVLTAIGLLAALFRPNLTPQPPIFRPIWLTLLTLLCLNLLLYLVYNITYVQHQSRYLFASLIPISVGVTWAWSALFAPLRRRYPTAAYGLPLLFGIGFAGLCLLALFRFIVPALTL